MMVVEEYATLKRMVQEVIPHTWSVMGSDDRPYAVRCDEHGWGWFTYCRCLQMFEVRAMTTDEVVVASAANVFEEAKPVLTALEKKVNKKLRVLVDREPSKWWGCGPD